MDNATIWVLGMTGVVAGGAMMVVFGVYWLLLARREGLAARLLSVPGTLHTVDYRFVRGAKGSSYWTIDTQYDYAVQGQAYKGKRPSLDFNSFASEAKARDVMTGIAPGPVTVWYDPSKPSWSSLRNSKPQQTRLIRTLALVALAVTLIGAIAALAAT